MAFNRRAVLAGAAATGALAACASHPRRAGDALGNDDAVGLAAKIRTGAVRAAEATEAAIARAERVNPQLNFIAAPAYDLGRTSAAGPLSGPLAGVPTFIKDLNPLAGVKFMQGTRALADNVAQANDIYVETLLRAGVVPIGKSTTPEFGLTCTTEPLVTGVTRNPWDPARIAGGSSGGAAVAVAAGVTPIAHASDGGGSVRIPAAICGLVGLKLSRGRQVGAPDPSPVSIGVDGCVSRTVRDTAAWLAATERSGEGALYPATGLVSGASTKRLKIGLMVRDPTGAAPDAETDVSVQRAAVLCAHLGHEVREISASFDGQAFIDAFILYWAAGAADAVQQMQRLNPGKPPQDILEPLTLQLAAHAASKGPGGVGEAVAYLTQFDAIYAAMFADLDVILTPTLARVTPMIGEMAPTLPFDVGFRRVLDYVRYTPMANAGGGCAISLPLFPASDGMPLGAHFMAPKGAERTLLELAYELEAAAPWAARKPPIWAGG